MYESNLDPVTREIIPDTIVRVSDGAIIPFDITNTDYQEYLKWEAERNPKVQWAPETPPVKPMTMD